MKYDHLSSDQFWDVIYAVAKNKKKRKKEWLEILSPDYANVVRNLAEAHIKRLDAEIKDVAKYAKVEDSRDLNSMRKAREFIDKIRKTAMRSSEMHTAQNKHVRRYEKIEVLHEYISYLKDTLEDLHFEHVGFGNAEDFTFYATLDDMKNDQESSIEQWIQRRVERRKVKNAREVEEKE